MRTALITGASTGIGRATALQLDRGGWAVFAGVRRESDAESLREAGSERLTPLMIDIGDQASIDAAAASVGEEFSLDGLVNNAGIAVPGPLETLPIEEFRRQVEINMTAQLAVTQALLPAIRRARGRIVFVSSVGGRIALPFTGAYHASKWGLEAIGDVLRQELSPWGIHVSLIEPGAVTTPIWERGESEGDAIIERAGDEHHELYGKRLDHYRKLVKKSVSATGIPPEMVADKIEHALTATHPRTRYLVGRDANINARVRRFMPDRIMDRLIDRQMGWPD
jgi:NAD(P)-dependent dehydrogenase (short-subunit alcohol dehydrogenase family)